MMNFDPVLVAQVGAFVGSSFVLYKATTPAESVVKTREVMRSSKALLDNNSLSKLTGAKRYAPRYKKQASMGRDDLEFE